MPKYLVQVDASNLLVELDGAVAKRGFIALRYVEAPSANAAEEAALEMITRDDSLSEILLNEEDDPPAIEVDEITELEAGESFEIPPGRIWYEMNPKRWWQFWRK